MKKMFLLLLLVFNEIAYSQVEGYSINDQYQCHILLEEFYNKNRINPKGINREAIKKKVNSLLAKEKILKLSWNFKINEIELQSELNRMIRTTQDSEKLSELFLTLNNDVGLIKECIVRPILIDRFFDDFFYDDESINDDLYSKILQVKHKSSKIKIKSGAKIDSKKLKINFSNDKQFNHINDEKLQINFSKLKSYFPNYTINVIKEVPLETNSIIIENKHNFQVFKVLSKSSDFITLQSMTWDKIIKENWIRKQKVKINKNNIHKKISYNLPKIQLSKSTPQSIGWEIPKTPTGRYEHSAIWTGNKMIIWGGRNNSKVLNSGYMYNPALNSWHAISNKNAPSPRTKHSAVWTGSKMIVWGGGNSLNSGGIYDPSNDTWTDINVVNAPDGTYSHNAIWTGEEMIVWGGFESFFGGRYNPDTDSWQTIAPQPEVASRIGGSVIWTGEEMIVWSGRYNFGLAQSGGAKYSPTSDSWTVLSQINAPSPRAYHSTIWTGNEMIIWGGSQDFSNGLNDGYIYNPTKDMWTALPSNNAPQARLSHASVWTGNKMVVWGGYDGLNSISNAKLFNLNLGVWENLSLLNAPINKSYLFSTIWTGSEMIVWGGDKGSGSYRASNTGGKFNPTSNTWSTTLTSGEPEGRYLHSSNWTGNELIIWGGAISGSDETNDGGIFVPITNSWTETSLLNAPSKRYGHTSEYQNNSIIYWGGIQFGSGPDDFLYLKDGYNYNIASNLWQKIADFPLEERAGHSSIWTGSEMIIWGGVQRTQSGRVFLNNGAKYDSLNNSWQLTSTLNSPSHRANHSSIWTGEEMIIWGGNNDDTLDTGSIYNPLQNSWRPIQSVNAPTNRYLHSSIWTGKEMIVWGGIDEVSGLNLNDGKTYDYNMDAWIDISLANAPSSRFAHSAVWTGQSMIIWGGSESSGDGGAEYDMDNDSWKSVSNLNEPSIRNFHTANWINNRMYVWGGKPDSYLAIYSNFSDVIYKSSFE